MPLTYNDLRPGDLLLCYGWNTVGKLQGFVKSTHRVVRVATFPVSAPIMLAMNDPVGVGKGSAACNHALVIGEPLVQQVSDDPSQVPLGEAVPGARYKIAQEQSRWQLIRVHQGTSTTTDIHEVVAPLGIPDSHAVVLRGVVYAMIPRSHSASFARVCHSTGGGCNWQYAQTYFAEHAGKLAAFRLRGDGQSERLAQQASQIAARWAVEAGTNLAADTRYSQWKAFWSAFHSHCYGSGAEKRAAIYRQHRDTAGGPPSSNMDKARRGKQKDWFCSMFAIACFHAATADAREAQTYLPLDAKHTTPMTLDGFVRTSKRWQLVGTT